MNEQFIIVDFKNQGTFIYKIVSDEEITLDMIVEYFEKNEDWNEEKDSITLVSKPEKIKL